MGRKLSSCLLGIAAIFLVVTCQSLYNNNLLVKNSPRPGNTGALRAEKLSDYIGVSGSAAIFPLRCSTCALIGTSGHLRESSSGNEIDKNYSCIFRFYPFLKKPLKLVTGPFPSDFWFLFDRVAGDITRFHGPFLKDLLQKHDSKFLWFGREVERDILKSVRNKRLNSGVNRISSLWFATRIIEDAGCESLTVYGVPDSQICKRNFNVSLPSLYWDVNSPHICESGVDASVKPTNTKASVSIVPSVAERRLLPQWLETHFYASDFKFPSWTNWTS